MISGEELREYLLMQKRIASLEAERDKLRECVQKLAAYAKDATGMFSMPVDNWETDIDAIAAAALNTGEEK